MKKMTKEKEFNMGSHLPVLQAVLESFRPTGIMELGAGIKSTPLLYDYGKRLISIESDKEWVDAVKAKTGNRENFSLVHHNVGIDRKTKYHAISTKIARESVGFYKKLISNELDFLFIDHVSGLRPIALEALFRNFKITAYHDAQEGRYFYSVFFKKAGKSPKEYSHLIFQSIPVYTGILIHDSYSDKIDLFEGSLKKYGSEYCRQFGKEYNHSLRRI